MSEPTRTHPPQTDDDTRTAAPAGNAESGEGVVAAPPGYELHSLLGQGGMGVVYRAREAALDRDVAVKILHSRYGPGSASAARFLEEARITGQLQHPGIPPIHHVGALPDGRPFLAMKLIKGDTLDNLLKEQPAPAARPGGFLSPFEQMTHASLDRLDSYLRRGRLLAIFEQVAQAVAYAHDRRVVHRDLKPANVMVGAFGEVQVMDWGLAKLLGDERRGEPQPDADTLGTEIRSLRDRGEMTQAGSLLGTPAYMPPEQAIGAVDQIDQRSDVFGLGGILCAILTGQPPYVGADSESTRQLAARAKLEDAVARLDGCGAEPELVALAKRCLAAEKDDRPKDAGEVAKAVADLRADAERRLRQAEMDRARSEVKAAEERKRRRVQYALALSVLGLLAVAGFAAWWAESVRAQRRADEQAREQAAETERKEREAALRARQLATERDVLAALNEVQVLREQGWKQADDPDRWALTLVAARSAQSRAESLLASGEPSGELPARVRASAGGLDEDERDRTLLVELNRAADRNEIRYFFPFPMTTATADQFAAAFRTRGIDLLAVPTDQAVAWLKAHRLRDRLVVAVRNWQQSLPTVGLAAPIDPRRVEALEALAAVAGSAGPVALAQEPNQVLEKFLRGHGPQTQLGAILNAVTEDTFTKEWWKAVERRDMAKLKELVAGPELRRMAARGMASLADGLNKFTGTEEKFVDEFLAIALDRFPGEFWVHFRLALRWQFQDGSDPVRVQESYRHLTAALAIRPTSSVARLALGSELIEHHNDERAGVRMLETAMEADPTSPWPHLFLGMHAVEKKDWPLAFRAFKECIRVDPDTGYFMTSATAFFFLTDNRDPRKSVSDRELVNYLNELIALHPKHPGGYDLLGSYYLQSGDHRSALPVFRKAVELEPPDSMRRSSLVRQLKEFEGQAAWEEKLPAVLRGELEPANGTQFMELATYCATFDRKFALATRFAGAGFEADADLLGDWFKVANVAGWAVQAGAGNGADGATTPLIVRERYRRQALGWLRETLRRGTKDSTVGLGFYVTSLRDLAPVRDPEELAKLPPDERAAWEKFWVEVTPVIKKRKSKEREVAPPPGEVGR